MTKPTGSIKCSLCPQISESAVGESIREPIVREIQQQRPNWSIDQPICWACLNRFRAEHVRRLLEEERDDLSSLEEQVIDSLREQEAISANVNEQFDR